MKTDIGNKIRKIRELKGLSQDYIASQLQMSQRAYSKLENNDIKLDWQRIEAISKILEIEPIDLISFDDNLIFNNCSQSGKFQVFNNNFPDDLKKSYEDRIVELKEEILFLRKQLSIKKLQP